MCIFAYLCVSFTRWVYLYIEGRLVVNTISENDIIRRTFVCVSVRVCSMHVARYIVLTANICCVLTE
jgi:hypothetical protein